MDRDEVRKILGKNYKEFIKSPKSNMSVDDFGYCRVYYRDNKCEAIEIYEGEVFVNGKKYFLEI